MLNRFSFRRAFSHLNLYFVLFSFFLVASAEAVRADSVDDFINAEILRQKIPGLSVAVLRDGKIVKSQGYGLANVELSVPVKPETVFKIGSVSKQFIASGIMLLIADGKLNLDDKMVKYLDGAPESWKEITIRHLLTHTSGLVRESPDFDPRKIQSEADLIKAAYPKPLEFTPGEKHQYCNLGYFILAEIIHKISGKSWGDFLRERIFAKLGMSATRVTTLADILPNRANGYLLSGGKLENADNWVAVRPSGAFLSTIVDLAKWEAALYTDSVLRESIRKQMWTPATVNSGQKYPYGFGWEIEDFRGNPTIQHGGTLNGFRSQYTRFPDLGLTVIVLSNLENCEVTGIAKGVMTKYVPSIDLTTLKQRPDPDPEQTQMFRKLLDDFANGSKELSAATPDLNAALAAVSAANRNVLAERVKNRTAFEFLTKQDVGGKGFRRLGVQIESIWSYRFVEPIKTNYYTFYLTAEKKVALLEASNY